MKVRMSIPAMVKEHAKYTQAPAKEPVASLMNPVMYGPTNPPRLPNEFIRPMAPAAAVPERNVVGYDHHTPKGAYVPIAASTTKKMATHGSLINTPTPRPIAPMNKPMAPCQRFSLLLDEECPIYIIAAREAAMGMAVSQPMARLDQPDTDLSTCGIQ